MLLFIFLLRFHVILAKLDPIDSRVGKERLRLVIQNKFLKYNG